MTSARPTPARHLDRSDPEIAARVEEIRDALRRHESEKGAARLMGFAALFFYALGLLLVSWIAAAILGTGAGVPDEGRDLATTLLRWTIFGVLVGGLLAMAGPARRYHDRKFRVTSFGTTADDLTLVDETDDALHLLLDVVYFPAYLLSVFLRMAVPGRLSPSAPVIGTAALLLARMKGPDGIAGAVAHGGPEMAEAFSLIQTLGLARLHRPRRAGGGAGFRPDARDEPGTFTGRRHDVRPAPTDRIVSGLRVRWQTPTGVRSGTWCTAFREGTSILVGDGELVAVDAEGVPAWSRPLDAGTQTAAISPDGKLVALLTDWAVILRSARTGDELRRFRVQHGAISIAVTDDADRIGVGDRFGRVNLFDRDGLDRGGFKVPHPAELLALASDTEIGATASRGGQLSILRPSLGEVLTVVLRKTVDRLRMEEDGERAIAVLRGEGPVALDLATRTLDSYALDRPVLDADPDAPGDLLALLGEDGRLVILDGTARILWQGDAPTGAREVRMDQDATRVWCRDDQGQLTCLRALDAEQVEERALDLLGAAPGTPTPPVESPAAVVLPHPPPGGFRRLLAADGFGAYALHHADGILVLLDGALVERGRWRGPEGVGSAAFAGDGSFVALAGEREAAIAVPGRTELVRTPTVATTLWPLPGSRIALAASWDGDLRRVGPDGLEPLARLGKPPTQLAARGLGDDDLAITVAHPDGTVIALDGRGEPRFRIPRSRTEPPLQLAMAGDRILIAEASGRMRLLDLGGETLAERTAGVPAQDVVGVGDRFVVVDRLGDLHLYGPRLEPIGSRPAPRGLHRVLAHDSGETRIALLHRRSLTLETWDGEARGRWELDGTPLGLAASTDGAWVALTTTAIHAAGLGAEGPRAEEPSDRASFLEL